MISTHTTTESQTSNAKNGYDVLKIRNFEAIETKKKKFQYNKRLWSFGNPEFEGNCVLFLSN